MEGSERNTRKEENETEQERGRGGGRKTDQNGY